MRYNVKQWAADLIAAPVKAPLPILSFPCTQLMNIPVGQLVKNSHAQAEGMVQVAAQVPSAAAVSLMDLSVEAEAFGAAIHFTDNEVPTVVGALVSDEDQANALNVPSVGAGRTGICIDAIREASRRITDRPVLAGIIGPYSLASRLMGVSDTMIYCYEEPDMVHTVLEKAARFLIQYCQALRQAGANGVIMAEPMTGLLSPALAREFSHGYVRSIVSAVQDEDFCLIYHNCGNNVPLMAEDIYSLGAMGYHFGDAIDLMAVLPKAPAEAMVMGNISPVTQFRNGTPQTMAAAVAALRQTCGRYPNFLLSSGCDIPPQSPWENIHAFFDAAR